MWICKYCDKTMNEDDQDLCKKCGRDRFHLSQYFIGCDVTLPDEVFRLELFKDNNGIWNASINYQERYSSGATPSEAISRALKQSNSALEAKKPAVQVNAKIRCFDCEIYKRACDKCPRTQ